MNQRLLHKGLFTKFLGVKAVVIVQDHELRRAQVIKLLLTVVNALGCWANLIFCARIENVVARRDLQIEAAIVTVTSFPIEDDGVHFVKVKANEGVIVSDALKGAAELFCNGEERCVVLVLAQVVRYSLLVVDAIRATVHPHVPLNIPRVIFELVQIGVFVADRHSKITICQIESIVISEVVLHSEGAHGGIVL